MYLSLDQSGGPTKTPNLAITRPMSLQGAKQHGEDLANQNYYYESRLI